MVEDIKFFEEKKTEEDQLLKQQATKLKMDQFMGRVKLEQNLLLAITAGVATSIICAFLWAGITVATEYQIGYMAIAVGFLVGYTVRYFGKGIDQIYGVIGGALALLSCLLGNFFTVIGFAAKSEGMDLLDVFLYMDYGYLPEIMMAGFSPMDLLFYGLAIYEGYKFSFRVIEESEIASALR